MEIKQKSKAWYHLAPLGFLLLVAAYSVYTYKKLLSSLSLSSSSSPDANIPQQHNTDHESLTRGANINTQSTIIPYSPCHYPVPSESYPHYKLGDEALMTCIDSLKTAATEAANKWPRDLVSSSSTNNLNGKGKYYKTQIINYILPTWLCPTEERIGGYTNDGAKWICAPRLFLNKHEPCYVYSFGSNANFEFEDYLSRIAVCETHIFDPTPGIKDKLNNITLPSHYHFHFEAFGGQINKKIELQPFTNRDQPDLAQTFYTKTLDEFVEELQTPYIDILKIDVEGSELNDIFNTDDDSIWTTHRIGQVLVEVHLNFDDEKTFERLFKLFDLLAAHGYVLFHSEWNVHALRAYEFAFIDLDYKSPHSSLTYLERLLLKPYTIMEENAADLSDSSAFINFLEGESRRGWPPRFSFQVPEATYHCHNKVFMGNRSDLQKYFMYLCVDRLNQGSNYAGIYETEDKLGSSSVEEAVESSSLFINVTAIFSPSTSTSTEHLDTVATALKQFDVVKIDLPNMLLILSSLNHIDSQNLLLFALAKIIHIELHVCDHTDYFDLRARFIQLRILFESYGYDIYHKEVTFVDSLDDEREGFDSDVCHLSISFIKRS